jgi:hypothetical protein
MHGLGVGIREDGHGADAHAAGGPHDTARNLATVGDENFAQVLALSPYLGTHVPNEAPCNSSVKRKEQAQ